MQERLLFPRVLYFGNAQLYFKCNTTELYECCWHPMTVYRHESPANDHITFSNSGSKSSDDVYHSWRNVVASYTRCFHSVDSDKLPTLAGIAKTYATLAVDVYLAGVFRKDLAQELAWLANDIVRPVRPYQSYVAPSWSWVSVDEPVFFLGSRLYSSAIHLEDHDIQLVTQNVFGQVASGSIVLRGRVQIATGIRAEKPESPDLRRHESTLVIQSPVNPYYPIASFDLDQDTIPLTLGHKETITCLLLLEKIDVGENHNAPYGPPWYGLVLEPVSGKPNTYRRLGIIRSENCVMLNDGKEQCRLNCNEHMSFWDNAALRSLTVIEARNYISS